MKFSTTWKSSAKPKKQRKYRANTPLHLKGSLLKTHLAKDLSKKYEKRTLRVIKGDKVRIMTGQFKGKSGKVDEINMSNQKLYVEGIEFQKAEGTKIRVPVAVSNVMITELNMNDKKRQATLKRK